jgi:sugar/nucleoside kinase (ribokinase family)
MPDTSLDVVGIGNAIVDVIARADDRLLVEQGVVKGAMNLIDSTEAEDLYAAMGPGIEISGGSAANTIVGISSMGGSGAYIGKVKNDVLGSVFSHDIRAAGVQFETPRAEDGPPTARSLILVTPDAQRSMNTYLGACVELGPEDVAAEWVSNAQVTYLEGYLWDPPAAKEAFRRAVDIAHGAGRRVALSLSDSFCVERYRAEFEDFVEHSVDILFANEEEIMALYQADTFDAALQEVRAKCEIAALTRGSQGSVIVSVDEVHIIDPERVGEVVDTTGAGDLFAAGFLFGLTGGRDLGSCGRLGGIAAAEIISHLGARPEADLQQLISRQGL